LRRRIWSTLDVARPDVLAVAGWGEPGMREAARWGRRRGVPMLLMSDSQYHDERRIWWKEWLKRRYVANFRAGFVAGSPHIDYLVRLGMPRVRINVGYDVVDNDHFARGSDAARADAVRLRVELGLPERYFLTCARFVPKKNLGTLLDAFQIYRRLAGPDAWGLVLIGDGPLRSLLEAQIARLDLTGHVYLPGFQQYDCLPTYFGLASALVLPSVQEQWGLVVNEALAAGLPVLASRICGCVPDLLGDCPDAVFDPLDTLGMADRMVAVAGSAADSGVYRSLVEVWGLERFATGIWGSARLPN
jgi:glycosyltransferase involved in cell wall biosynthesis